MKSAIVALGVALGIATTASAMPGMDHKPMSAKDKKALARCQAMTHDKAMKNKRCMTLMKHAEMKDEMGKDSMSHSNM